MPNAGVANYYKYKTLACLASISTLKCAIYTSASTISATVTHLSPQVYTETSELGPSLSTGYLPGGYPLTVATVSNIGLTYRLEWRDFATSVGTISADTYYAMIYDTADSNRALFIFTVSIASGSNNQSLTFSIPSDLINLT